MTTRYVRYEQNGRAAFGRLEGDRIAGLSAAPWDGGRPTGADVPAADVRLLAPCTPSKVIAVGLNYKSHLQGRPEAGYPGIFLKLPTSIVGPDADVVLPPGAGNVHYEGEMVVVIGRRASRVSRAEAAGCIFGVTCGNDISERDWQKKDLQWFRAKASDTFGPLGPAVVQGLDYTDLQLQTRVNGEVRQSARTKDLIFPIDEIVSFVTTFVTLEPGDIIYTGTPGTTQAMQPGDVVEVELEGVGVLRNRIAAGA
ncbi:MAG: fumarylacetoacetate hydrolase family protein [Acidobacteriota bacterium]|nr:fumarylacetoacetate hydrolase family protein [Acidobacteriota bacterium]